MLGLEFDEEALKEAWMNGNLEGNDIVKGQAAAFHAANLREDIRHMLREKGEGNA